MSDIQTYFSNAQDQKKKKKSRWKCTKMLKYLYYWYGKIMGDYFSYP